MAREPDPERKESLAADLERLRREDADVLLDMRVEHPKLSGFITVEAVTAQELVSLSRAFSYAGARSILSTLWRVDDVSTALVSKHFYRHYVAHGAAESLRHAQLQVMNDGRHYHPTYWAGVLLTGDYR